MVSPLLSIYNNNDIFVTFSSCISSALDIISNIVSFNN